MTIGTGLPDNYNVYSFTKAKFSEFGYFMSGSDMSFVDLKLELFFGGRDEPDNRFFKYCKDRLIKGEKVLLSNGTQLRDMICMEDVLYVVGKLLFSDFFAGGYYVLYCL